MTFQKNLTVPSAERLASLGTNKIEAMRLFLVEDDDDYREVVSGELSDHGFDVTTFADGQALRAAVAAGAAADVIVLDWCLPNMSGIDLLAELRTCGTTAPVVFLTGYAMTRYEALALETGAADFVDKARGVDVLVRRLNLLVGPKEREPKPAIPVVRGRLVLQPGTRRAFWNEVDVGLTFGEYAMVHCLAANVGRQVSYRLIYDCLHYEGFVAGTGDYGYRVNVRSAIKRIRQKFCQCDLAFEEIENCAAFGYRWKESGVPRFHAPQASVGDEFRRLSQS